MAVKISNITVIDDARKFYGDGSNLTNVAKYAIVGVRTPPFTDRSTAVHLYSNQLIVGPVGLSTITVYGRTLNTNVITA